jgi:ABC-2 type transport system permease protein
MKSPVTVTLMELAALTLVAVAIWPLITGQYLASAGAMALVAAVMGLLFLARRRQPA